MALSNILKPNSNNLYSNNFTASGDVTVSQDLSVGKNLSCANLNASGNVSSVGKLSVNPTLNSEGGLQANAHLEINPSGLGEAFVTAGNELRWGLNGTGAGIKMNWSNGGQDASLFVNGPVNSNNSVKAYGSDSWANGGNSLTVSAPGVVAGDHIHITPTAAGSGGAVLSHVTAGTDEFTVNLSTNDTSNTYEFNWHVLPAIA